MRRFAMALVSMLLAGMLLGGCGNVPGVPDHSYFRMSRPQELPRSANQDFDVPIVVGLFAADGLYADRALVYALDPDARELRQYHYQLWTDPPTRILQRRLLFALREAGIAPLVIDELAASQAAVRISGVILRFERVPTLQGGFVASVVLKLRADRADGTPYFDEVYRAEVAAEGKALTASVDALGRAVDQIFAEFHADLVKAKETADAR